MELCGAVCGAVVKRWIQDHELACSTLTSTKHCVLEQDTLSTLLSTGFYPGRPAHNTQKMWVSPIYRKKMGFFSLCFRVAGYRFLFLLKIKHKNVYFIYSKSPKISYTKVSDEISYANSVAPEGAV